jgi:hypothetical protein
MNDPTANTRGWHHLANDGNWIVPRESEKFLPTTVKSTDVYATDAQFMLQQWLSAGYRITYVEGLQYIHTVHDGSSWLASSVESMRFLRSHNWTIPKN